MFNPQTTLVVALIATCMSVTYTVYIFTGVLLMTVKLAGQLVASDRMEKLKGARRGLNLVWSLTKWPALANLILDPFFHLVLHEKMGFWFWLFEALGFYNWWYYKDIGDDDDWKKLGKKVKDKIAVVRGKLTVVPEPA